MTQATLEGCPGPTIKAYQRRTGGAWQFSMRCQLRGAETQYWHRRDERDPTTDSFSFRDVPWTTPEILETILNEQHRRCLACPMKEVPAR